MIVRTLEHASCEGPLSILGWVERRGGRVERTRLWAGEMVPSADGIDLLVLMGGPMSVNDVLAWPWLVSEMVAIRSFIEAGGAVLGICLGAQLVAKAMGARVYAADHREIGWHTVRGIPGDGSPFSIPDRLPLFHWHGETFDLPPGARLLASSEACRNQVFSLGRRVLGIQCHPEMTPEGARDLIRACPGDLAPGPWVQAAAAILGAPADWYLRANDLCDRMLDYLVEGTPVLDRARARG